MSVNSLVKTTIETTGYDCGYQKYTGDNSVYFVFSYYCIPAAYSDDAPRYERYLVTINLFAPHVFDTVSLCKQIKILVHDAGFTYPTQIDASDKNGQNIVFECEYVEGIDA